MGAITDNRTLLDDAEGTVYDDLTGATGATADTEIFIFGTQSWGWYSTTSRDGLLYDAGTAQDWSNNVFYLWFNCGVAGLLDTQINGGITVRFCGATVTDYFEVYVGGKDTYSGGWKMLVVDIERARDIAVNSTESPTLGGTGGTPPATNAIRYVGATTITSATMPRMVDNTWLDAIWRLPKGTPGIIVSGQNETGSPFRPYTWADIEDAGAIDDPNKAWGTITFKDGIYTVNTPIQFGDAGSPDLGNHDFEDSNVTVAWESNIIYDDFYGISVVGDATNTQRLVAGRKSGDVGFLGWTITAAADGPRWFWTSTDANIDLVDILGCNMTHTTIIDIDNVNVEMRSTLLVDGERLIHSRVSSPLGGAVFERNTVVESLPFDLWPSPQ